MTDEQLGAVNEAATELADIAAALERQDEAWFHGNVTLVDYYRQLSARLLKIASEDKPNG